MYCSCSRFIILYYFLHGSNNMPVANIQFPWKKIINPKTDGKIVDRSL